MNVWIFQDQPGISMVEQLRIKGKGSIWEWNVDRYISDETDPHIERGDIVLQWQPYLNDAALAGIYASGRLVRGPYPSKGGKTNWKADVEIRQVLRAPITREEIQAMQDPVLLAMHIMRMPGGHIVFPVKPEAWHALRKMRRTE